MGRHADRGPSDDSRHGWRDRLLIAVVVLAATCGGVIWAGGGWERGLMVGAGAAVVVVGAIALGATMPNPPETSRDEQ